MPNEDGSHTPEEWKGLMTDKKNEVRVRQQTQADLAASNKVIEDQRTRIKDLESSTAKGKPAGNPEDIVTMGALTGILDQRDKKLTDDHTKHEDSKTTEARNKRLRASAEKAEKLHTEEKEGKGLAFADVMEGTDREIKKKPGLQRVIQEADNPGEEAYDIGLRDPVIAKRLETYKKTLPPPGITPKKGMETKKVPGAYYTPKMVQKMTDKQIDENYDDILESQKRWGGEKKEE